MLRGLEITVPIQPRQLRLELTNRCNARCAVCHRSAMARPQGDMDFELVRKCLEEARAFPEPLLEVVLSNYGESFLYRRWFEAFQLAAQKLPGTRIVVPTNGTLLSDGTVEKLARIPTVKLVNLSVNAYLPQTYEMFHGLPARHMETIKRAAARIRELRITLWISMAFDPTYQSPREVELFQELWGQYGIVQVNPAQYNFRRDREPPVAVSIPCRSLFSDLVVNWDGRASSCCFDADCDPDLAVGDANRETLLEIWHSARFNEIRRLHNAGRRAELPICRRCTFS